MMRINGIRWKRQAQEWRIAIARYRGHPARSISIPQRTAAEPAPTNATIEKHMASTEDVRMAQVRGNLLVRISFSAPMLENRYRARQVAVETVLAS